MIVDNLDISDGSYEADVPSAAVETIETMNFDDE